MTRYALKRIALGETREVPIDEASFAEFRQSFSVLLWAQGFEEKLDVVLQNFLELERELLLFATEYALFLGRVDDIPFEALRAVNRRTMNLLSSVRTYLDQTKHGLSQTFGVDSDELDHFTTLTNHEYDSTLGYRAMEAIRNSAQHRSLPVGSFSMSIDRGTPDRVEFRPIPFIRVRDLEQDPKFKTSVLEELRSLAGTPGNVEALPLLRAYVAAIGRIHEEMRQFLGETLTNADNSLFVIRERAKIEYHDSLTGVDAIHFDDSGAVVEYVPLNDRMVRTRRFFEGKNVHVGSSWPRFASSR